MNILNICGYSWEIGGPARIIYDHATMQRSLGAEVSILTPLSPGERVYPVPEGVRLITVPRHPLARIFPEFSPQLAQFLRRHADEFDLIHLHGMFHFGTVFPLMLRTRARRVVTVHGTLEPWALRKGRRKKELFSSLGQRRLLRRADLIHVNSAEEAADVRRYLGEKDVPPLLVLGNGMRLSDYERVPPAGTFRQKHGIAPTDSIILFLSRLNVKKGLDLLLPAALPLLRQRPTLRLVVAGSDDGYRYYVENFVRENDLQEQVLLPGLLTGDEKLAAFRDADAFVLPSYSEGFSIAALEALTLGVPALLSDRVGFGEQLRQSGASLLCELNVESVRWGLERLLDEPILAANFRERGPRFVREFADIQGVATRLYRAFEALLPGGASVETFP